MSISTSICVRATKTQIEKALMFLARSASIVLSEFRLSRNGPHSAAAASGRGPMKGSEQAEPPSAERLLRQVSREWKRTRDLSAKRGAIVRRDLCALLLRFHDLFPFKPVRLADGKFDGLVTVGDLYVLVCNALKIQPSSSPETLKGVARQPRQRTTPSKDPDYWTKYRTAWREFPGLRKTFGQPPSSSRSPMSTSSILPSQLSR